MLIGQKSGAGESADQETTAYFIPLLNKSIHEKIAVLGVKRAY